MITVGLDGKLFFVSKTVSLLLPFVQKGYDMIIMMTIVRQRSFNVMIWGKGGRGELSTESSTSTSR